MLKRVCEVVWSALDQAMDAYEVVLAVVKNAPIRQKCYDNDDQFRQFAESFEHRSASCAKRVFAVPTPIALPSAVMNTNVALSQLPSCQTALIGAKLLWRVHWFLLLLFHVYSKNQ